MVPGLLRLGESSNDSERFCVVFRCVPLTLVLPCRG